MLGSQYNTGNVTLYLGTVPTQYVLAGDEFDGVAATETELVRYNKLSVSRVKKQGTKYSGALWDADGTKITDFQNFYLDSGVYVDAIDDYNDNGEIWNVIDDPDIDVDKEVKMVKKEYTGSYKLRYYGGTRMLRVQNEEDKVTVPLYRAGNSYSDGLYSGFEPAKIKTRNVTALTV